MVARSLIRGGGALASNTSARLQRTTSFPMVVRGLASDPSTTAATVIQHAQTRSTAEHLQADRDLLWHPYTSMTQPSPVLAVHSAQGCHLVLETPATNHTFDNREKNSDGSTEPAKMTKATTKTTTLVDGMASWWSVIHGYRHPDLNRAMERQINEHMAHVMFGGLTHRPAVTLAEALVSLVNHPPQLAKKDESSSLASTPPPRALNKVFLADSGSVSVEVSLKMALQYQRGVGQGRAKTKFLSLRSGYHGDTMGAMSVCDPVNGMHSAFAENLMQNVFLPRPPCDEQYSLMPAATTTGCAGCTCHKRDAASSSSTYEQVLEEACVQMETLVAQHAATTAAVIVEPLVQGAGGMRFYDVRYLQRLRQACTEHNVLLIADEIATGMGRAGGIRGGPPALTACATAGVQPDILTLGKALTGGYLTLAAVLATEKVAIGVSTAPPSDDAVGQEDSPRVALPLMHGPTFMGNPLACSVAVESLRLLYDPAQSSYYPQAVPRIEAHLRQALAPATTLTQTVADVRVRGAIGVIERRTPLTDMQRVAEICQYHGAWLRPFGRLVYTMPPYVATADDLDRITDTMLALAAIE